MSSKRSTPVAIGYVRVSTSKQVEEGGSLKAQRESIARHCVISEYSLLDIVEDAGISGSKGEDSRPGLRAALDAIRTGRADVLVVTHIDRLSRDNDEGGHIRIEVKRAGGKVDSIAEVKDDPIRKAVDRMLADLERIRTSQRMKTWNAARHAKGLPAGPPPYGYRVGADGRLAPHAEEQKIIATVVAMRAEGFSLRDTADALDGNGIPCPRAKRWNRQTIVNITNRAGAPA